MGWRVDSVAVIWCFDVTDTLLHAHKYIYGNVDIDSGGTL